MKARIVPDATLPGMIVIEAENSAEIMFIRQFCQYTGSSDKRFTIGSWGGNSSEGKMSFNICWQPRVDVPLVSDAALAALLPGTYYMDDPNGGDTSILEQLRRMSEDAAKWRASARLMTVNGVSYREAPEPKTGRACAGCAFDMTIRCADAQSVSAIVFGGPCASRRVIYVRADAS